MLVSFYRFLRTPEHTRNILVVLVIYLILNWLVYLPFAIRLEGYYTLDFGGKDTTVFMRYWDGPFYARVAKTLYSPQELDNMGYNPKGQEYLTNHMPLYPLFIRIFAAVMPYEMAMLFVSQLFGILLAIVLYYFYCLGMKPRQAMIVSIVGLLLPHNGLILRNVGMSETLFAFLVTVAMIMVIKKKYYGVVLAITLAVLTRSTGLFMIPGLLIYWFMNNRMGFKKLVAVFVPVVAYGSLVLNWYKTIPGFNFFGRPGGFQNILTVPPFSMFHFNPTDAQGVLYVGIFCVAGAIMLFEKTARDWEKSVAVLAVSGVSFVLFSYHPDNMRYLYPYIPFLIFLPLRNIVTDKRFLWGLAMFTPGIIMMVWTTIARNQMSLDAFATWINALRS